MSCLESRYRKNVSHSTNTPHHFSFSHHLDPALGQDCQVCQDTFEVPDPNAEEKEAGMLITVTLPCKHGEKLYLILDVSDRNL